MQVLDLVSTQPPAQPADMPGLAAAPDTVSSSRIRAALERGDVAAVERALDRPYQLVMHLPSAELPSAIASTWTLRHDRTLLRPSHV